jgi:predicted metal-dependent hydrolase
MENGGQLDDAPDGRLAVVLQAGAAIYNAGHHHAAHDAWEDYWLELKDGTDDEQLLHGLIQFTAVVYHGTEGNWSGAQGLADSAVGYLSTLSPDARGVNLGDVEAYLGRVAVDPETLERRSPPELRIEDERVRLDGLSLSAAMAAAPVLATELDGVDPDVVDLALDYARAERDGGVQTTFIALVRDFVGEQRRRPLVYQRLAQQVQRRRQRENDVQGLFE